jgi:hypothetical protein
MGLMPPYDPFTDVALLWGVVRVLTCEPASPTWRNPGVVTLAVESVLRGPLPAQVTVYFDPPREAGQERFYAVRDATPEDAARQLAQLDERNIAVPTVGARVIMWLLPPTPPPVLPEGFLVGPPGGPGALPSGMVVDPPVPAGGFWTIPTLRQFSPGDLPMQQRWIEHSASVEATVRRRLGG